MAMPAPSSAPPPYYAPIRPGRGLGCLWGCALALILLFLPAILAGGYGGWILLEGYRRDPVFRLARQLARKDAIVEEVLGDGVAILGLRGSLFSWMPGFGHQAFDLSLAGQKGRGDLMVSGHEGFAGPKLDSAILTGPDGRRYDLLRHSKTSKEPGNWI